VSSPIPPTGGPSFIGIPDDVWPHILEYLPARDVGTCLRLNHHFNRLGTSNLIWERLAKRLLEEEGIECPVYNPGERPDWISVYKKYSPHASTFIWQGIKSAVWRQGELVLGFAIIDVAFYTLAKYLGFWGTFNYICLAVGTVFGWLSEIAKDALQHTDQRHLKKLPGVHVALQKVESIGHLTLGFAAIFIALHTGAFGTWKLMNILFHPLKQLVMGIALLLSPSY